MRYCALLMLSIELVPYSLFLLYGFATGLSCHPLVVIISFDGFRYDYVEKVSMEANGGGVSYSLLDHWQRLLKLQSLSLVITGKSNSSVVTLGVETANSGRSTTTFFNIIRIKEKTNGLMPVTADLRSKGVYTDHMKAVFEDETYPTHMSIATGLYPNIHGVIGNEFYDESLGRKLTSVDPEFWHAYQNITPIWIANQLKAKDRYSAVIGWPGSNFSYRGIRPTYHSCNLTSPTLPWNKRVEKIIQVMTHKTKPANLVLAYFEEPDAVGHLYGVHTSVFNYTLKLLDNLVSHLLHSLNDVQALSRTNLFLLSDHGMTNIPIQNFYDLNSIVKPDLYDAYDGSPTLHIYPKPGKEEEVYKALKAGMNKCEPFIVYKKKEMLRRWHCLHPKRTPPIFLLAKPGWVFSDYKPNNRHIGELYNLPFVEVKKIGVHGYDNNFPDMWPFFIATGPALKTHTKVEPFQSVDLFGVWAHILGFPEYSEGTNGSKATIAAMLKTIN